MLEKLLRARLPEQIVALIENLEQNPDTSHLEKIGSYLETYNRFLTKFECWMLIRAMRKVRKAVRRAELLQRAMSIVINEPEEKYDANTYTYKASGRYHLGVGQGTLTTAQELHDMAMKAQLAHNAQNTWTDPRIYQQRNI